MLFKFCLQIRRASFILNMADKGKLVWPGILLPLPSEKANEGNSHPEAFLPFPLHSHSIPTRSSVLRAALLECY